ncbi:MAG: hypothetical protein AAF288_12040 [Planctomycetota bacterium]
MTLAQGVTNPSPSSADAAPALSEPGLIETLLGLDANSALRLADPATRLVLLHPVPAWGWTLIVLGALATAGLSYRRIAGGRAWRGFLATLRAALIVLLALLLAEPALERVDQTLEPDTVVVLVDRSASMNTQDVPPDTPPDTPPESATETPDAPDTDASPAAAHRPAADIAVDPIGANSQEQPNEEPRTRARALADALAEHAAVFGPDGLAKDRSLVWLGFDATATPLPGADPRDWPTALGLETRLSAALRQGLEAARGKRVAAVIVLSDGRSRDAPSPELLDRLQRQGARVFVTPIGQDAALDLSVDAVDAPANAFAGDLTPVHARVQVRGALPDQTPIDPAQVEARLIDRVTGGVLDRALLSQAQPGGRVRLQGQSDTPGPAGWLVEVGFVGQPVRYTAPAPPETTPESSSESDPEAAFNETPEPTAAAETPAAEPEAVSSEISITSETENESTTREPAGLPPVAVDPALDPASDFPRELTFSNNQEGLEIDFTDRPIRVLYVDGYPRWEYRYLVNMLKRERSIDASILLRTADAAFIQEGDTPIQRFPVTAEELAEYDVLILGDIAPNYFGQAQLRLIRDHVAVRGAGLMWVGGSQHTPRAYADTPLADLLPVASPARVLDLRFGGDEIDFQPTPAAARLGVMQLTPPPGLVGDPALDPALQTGPGWPRLAPLYWAQNLGTLQPTAEVLAVAANVQTADGTGSAPLATRTRFGAGQVLYLATDETWRWRRGLGEAYFEQFHIQLVRFLGRSSLESAGQGATLRVEPPRLQIGQTAVVELALTDATWIERAPPAVVVSVRPSTASSAGPDAEPTQALRLSRQTPEAVAGRLVYSATWRPQSAGEQTLALDTGVLAALELSAAANVLAPDDELRRPEADRPALVALAAATDGQVVELADLGRLPQLVPNLAVAKANRLTQTVWDSWASLLAVLALATAEWLGRKRLQLP